MPLVKYSGGSRKEFMGLEHARLFPSRSISYIDPFIMLDHFAIEKPMGFPDHPHRGFEIITYVLHGALAHADSAGNESVIVEGGVQKVTAGRGIVHSEMPGTDGIDSGLQLWINLPRAKKGVDPEYQELLPNELPRTNLDGVHIRHIVGGDSPVHMRRPMYYQDVELEDGASYNFQISPSYQGFIYVLSGEGTLLTNEEFSASKGDLFQWSKEPETTSIRVKSSSDFRLVLAAGEPIGERPIFNGPFVD